MTKKTTKRALLSSLMAMLLCFTMLLGTTFAWFTDSVTSANNIIKSGNLDIVLEYWDGDSWEDVQGTSGILTNELWEPGATEVAYLRVANAGSLALKYQLGVNIASETEGVNAAGETFLLSDYIQFGVVEGLNGETDAYAEDERADAIAEAAANAKKISEGYADAQNLDPVDEDDTTVSEIYLALVVYMPEEVGNVANHDGETIPEINLGIEVVATQVEAEFDSFGDDYDANAGYDRGTRNVGPYKLNVLAGGTSSYDSDTKTYTNTIETLTQGNWNAAWGNYYAGFTVYVGEYGENASVKFTKADGTEVTWYLADEEADGFITNGVHQMWSAVGSYFENRYDIDGDGVTDFTVINDVSNAVVVE